MRGETCLWNQRLVWCTVFSHSRSSGPDWHAGCRRSTTLPRCPPHMHRQSGCLAPSSSSHSSGLPPQSALWEGSNAGSLNGQKCLYSALCAGQASDTIKTQPSGRPPQAYTPALASPLAGQAPYLFDTGSSRHEASRPCPGLGTCARTWMCTLRSVRPSASCSGEKGTWDNIHRLRCSHTVSHCGPTGGEGDKLADNQGTATPLTFMPGYQEARERMRAEVYLPHCLIALI